MDDTLKQIGSTDEEKRIALQEEVANFDNTRKVFEGGYLRLQRAHVVEQRQAEEARMATWIAANADTSKEIRHMLADIKTLSDVTNATAKRDVIMRRFPDPNSMVVLRPDLCRRLIRYARQNANCRSKGGKNNGNT